MKLTVEYKSDAFHPFNVVENEERSNEIRVDAIYVSYDKLYVVAQLNGAKANTDAAKKSKFDSRCNFLLYLPSSLQNINLQQIDVFFEGVTQQWLDANSDCFSFLVDNMEIKPTLYTVDHIATEPFLQLYHDNKLHCGFARPGFILTDFDESEPETITPRVEELELTSEQSLAPQPIIADTEEAAQIASESDSEEGKIQQENIIFKQTATIIDKSLRDTAEKKESVQFVRQDFDVTLMEKASTASTPTLRRESTISLVEKADTIVQLAVANQQKMLEQEKSIEKTKHEGKKKVTTPKSKGAAATKTECDGSFYSKFNSALMFGAGLVGMAAVAGIAVVAAKRNGFKF